MKKILLLLVSGCCLSFCASAQSSYAQSYAGRVAQKMKDSLSLSDLQRTQIYNINIQLSNQKAGVWQQYRGEDSLIGLHLQQVENTRDSLYMPVLGETKFALYQEKKRNLVNNN